MSNYASRNQFNVQGQYGGPYPSGQVQNPMPQQPAGSVTQQGAQMPAMPRMPAAQSFAVTDESMQYLNGLLRTQIGKKITVTFLIGTNTQVDKTGTLLEVGVNYIVINEIETDDLVVCDFYTIKFVQVYY
ncbi:MAG TPA: hypothetical protein VHR42_07495 [Clostridia bacterium]|nr:hypothetical protein [Clostridia bacterium]